MANQNDPGTHVLTVLLSLPFDYLPCRWRPWRCWGCCYYWTLNKQGGVAIAKPWVCHAHYTNLVDTKGDDYNKDKDVKG